MHEKMKKFMPIVIISFLIIASIWYLVSHANANHAIIASGTVEAVQVRISPELSGRVVEVLVQAGDRVEEGDVLLQMDTSLLEAQRDQAEASLTLAQANLSLLEAGGTDLQVAAAQAAVVQAETAVDIAQRAVDNLPESAEDTNTGRAIQLQLDQAQTALSGAQAQFETISGGARSEQLDAAHAQVDAAQAALDVVNIQISRMTITAPTTGVILSRAVQPGEFTTPGATLMILGEMDALTVTVYVPEDRYGVISLGSSYPVSIDSFPDEVFIAIVTHIADQAEFTPRNVQTVESRSNTVFAIDLQFEPVDERLHPGMPADVNFSIEQ